MNGILNENAIKISNELNNLKQLNRRYKEKMVQNEIEMKSKN